MYKKIVLTLNYSFKLIIVSLVLVCCLLILDGFEYIDFAKPYVVLSGSMEPNIPTGSLIFVRSKNFGYMYGDIVTFSSPSSQNVVTHRIVALEVIDNKIVYRTQGDANDTPDPKLVEKEQVIGNVRLVVPYVGYMVKFGRSPKGFVFMVIIPATILIYEELKKIKTLTCKIIKNSITSWIGVVFSVVLIKPNSTLTNFSNVEISSKNILGASSIFESNDIKIPNECKNLSENFFNVIIGTEKDETLIGSIKNDLIIGLSGNDVIKGGSGKDCIISGNGNDLVSGGSGEDIIFAQEGDDFIELGTGDDHGHGGNGNDFIFAGSGSDKLIGNTGFDNLDGGSGKDDCLSGENLVSCEVL